MKTCGELLKSSMSFCVDAAQDGGFKMSLKRLFFYDYLVGLAEKVYLGACTAAMIDVKEWEGCGDVEGQVSDVIR